MKPAKLSCTLSLALFTTISFANVVFANVVDDGVVDDDSVVVNDSEIIEDYRDSQEYQNEISRNVESSLEENNQAEIAAETQDHEELALVDAESEETNSFFQTKLPGEEIDFKLKLHKSNLHYVAGRARSDIGKVLFKSRLMPSNEVKLSLTLKQHEIEDVQLVGYFDLANFTMELDGANAILNKDHKELIHVLNQHLRSEFEVAYRDYDLPEHAFMLVQMLSYWSVSPEGYVHEKREIVANY